MTEISCMDSCDLKVERGCCALRGGIESWPVKGKKASVKLYSGCKAVNAQRSASKPLSAEHVGGDSTGNEGRQEQRRQAKKSNSNLICKVFHWLLPFTAGTFAEDYGRTAILCFPFRSY